MRGLPNLEIVPEAARKRKEDRKKDEKCQK